MVMFSFNLLFPHKSSLNASRFEVINSLFMGQTDFFLSGGAHLTNFFSMGDLEVTFPGPLSFVMSGQSHVLLAYGTAPIGGGHSVLSAWSRIFKWRLTRGSQGCRVRKLTSAGSSKPRDSMSRSMSIVCTVGQLCFPRMRLLAV